MSDTYRIVEQTCTHATHMDRYYEIQRFLGGTAWAHIRTYRDLDEAKREITILRNPPVWSRKVLDF